MNVVLLSSSAVIAKMENEEKVFVKGGYFFPPLSNQKYNRFYRQIFRYEKRL